MNGGPPLDDDLSALVRNERAEPDLPPDHVARARARLETRLLVGGALVVGATAAGEIGETGEIGEIAKTTANAANATASVGATAHGVGLGKVIGIALVALAIGSGAGYFAGRAATSPLTTTTAPVAAPTTLAPATSSATANAVSPSTTSPSAFAAVDVASLPSVAAPVAAAPREPSNATVNQSSAVEVIARERALLDQAGRALREGDGGKALALVDRHAHDFPRGSLVEEREVLAIQSLASLGREDDAKARMATFERRFATSPFLPALRSQVRDRH